MPTAAFKPDFVICVSGTPCYGWLEQPSDEQDEDALIVTTDRSLVCRYSSAEEAMPTFNMLVAAHPRQSFRLMTIAPLGQEGAVL